MLKCFCFCLFYLFIEWILLLMSCAKIVTALSGVTQAWIANPMGMQASVLFTSI